MTRPIDLGCRRTSSIRYTGIHGFAGKPGTARTFTTFSYEAILPATRQLWELSSPKPGDQGSSGENSEFLASNRS